MHQNPLIQTLSRLERKQMTRFREFSDSPYFNKHKDVRALVQYLSDIYPDFSEKKCDRQRIFQYLYPTCSHNQPKLAIIFTYTLRLLEHFFRVEEADRQGLSNSQPLLLQYLRRNGFFSLLKLKWKENFKGVNKNNRNTSFASSEYFERRHHMAAEMDACSLQLKRQDLSFLLEKQQWLDAYYLTEKFRDACEQYQRSIYLSLPYQSPPLLRHLMNEVQLHPETYLKYETVLIYYHLYSLLSANEADRYEEVRKQISEPLDHLAKEDLQNVLNYLQNFCIRQINQGHSGFLRKLFDIYQYQLEKELLIVNDSMPEWHYKNIVTTALRLDEHEWTRNFIETYHQRLLPDVADNAYSYNLAAYYYHLKKYHEVLKLLVQVEYTDLRYNLDAKSLLLRTYYDLEEEEALLALTDSFRQFLKRNRTIPEFQKKGYYNLLKFTKRAFRLKQRKGLISNKKWEADCDKLRNDIDTAETTFNRSWIWGKIEGLGNSD